MKDSFVAELEVLLGFFLLLLLIVSWVTGVSFCQMFAVFVGKCNEIMYSCLVLQIKVS